MNAYELADFIETGGENIDRKELVNMLRQQADRISVLEANDEIQLNIVKKQQDYIDQLEQGLRASIELNKAQAERQTKPLSDEEISQVYKEISEPFGEKRLYEIHDFAKAIEERHGIK